MSIQIPPPEILDDWRPFVVQFLVKLIPIADGMQSITSFWRSPEKNRQVHGSPKSQHLIGTALDVVPRGDFEAFKERARLAGLVAVNEGDHVHLQLFQAGQRPPGIESGVQV